MQILEPQQFATWNEPIDMLYACHSKVKRFCKQLTILPGYLEKNGVNQAVLNDVKTILQYFNHAAPLHHDDEEKDFFPALIEKAPQAKESVDELERQHVTLHENWAKLSEQLEELIAEKRTDVDERLITLFVASYDTLPLKSRYLSLVSNIYQQNNSRLWAKLCLLVAKLKS